MKIWFFPFLPCQAFSYKSSLDGKAHVSAEVSISNIYMLLSPHPFFVPFRDSDSPCIHHPIKMLQANWQPYTAARLFTHSFVDLVYRNERGFCMAFSFTFNHSPSDTQHRFFGKFWPARCFLCPGGQPSLSMVQCVGVDDTLLPALRCFQFSSVQLG